MHIRFSAKGIGWLLGLCFLSVACQTESAPDHVRDLASILNPDASQALDQQLTAYRAETGVQWYLHTQPSLEVPTIDALALKLNSELQLGTPGLNNGGLIMLTQRERQVRIEVQDGLAWQIPDTASAAIYAEIRPLLSEGAYGAAFQAGFEKLQALANTVSWEVAFQGLDQLIDSQAIGQIVRFEGEATEFFQGAVRPEAQFSPTYQIEVVGASGKSVRVFFTNHMFQWVNVELIPQSPQTIFGRVLSVDPLAVALLGILPADG